MAEKLKVVIFALAIEISMCDVQRETMKAAHEAEVKRNKEAEKKRLAEKEKRKTVRQERRGRGGGFM